MLYIRHAQKSYSNGCSDEFPLDPDLTDKGRKDAKDKFKAILDKYGVPSKIISSPYLRARETAQIAHDVIKQITGKNVEIIYDSLIGEYLGHQRKKDINKCLRPETLAYQPIPPENWKQYSFRVRKYTNNTINNESSTLRLWYITHGIIIKSIAHFRGITIPYPKELEGIYIDSKEVITI